MKKWLSKLGFHTGLTKLLLKIRRGEYFRVLMYHHVTEEPELFLSHVTSRVFACQMEYLKKEYRVRELDTLVEMVKRNESPPPRSVALTFDDEYEDVYLNAFPLLKKYNLPATVFITTGFVDTDMLPWTDELGFLFKNTSKTVLEFECGGRTRRFNWGALPSKINAFREIKIALKTILDAERNDIFRRIKEQLAVSGANPVRILNGGQIREMAESGIDFGAHSVHHPILTRIPPRQAQEEIIQSKVQLERVVGQEVKGFCYPNGEEGDFDNVIKGMVRHAGYHYACTTIDGVNGLDADPYALKRTWTSEPSLSLFAARLLRRRP